MELHENALSAQAILGATSSHGFPAPLLSDDAWKIALSNEQLPKFGIRQVTDPVWQLAGLYTRIKLVNQVILARQWLVFSTIRVSTEYDQILHLVDDFLMKQIEELSPAIDRAKQNLLSADFRSAFASRILMTEQEK